MPQAVWTGELSFGLVSIPVKLYSATAPKRVRFHQYEAGTGRRIRHARVPTGPTLEEPDESPSAYETESDPPAPEVTGAPPARTGPGDALESPEDLPSASQEGAEVPWDQVVRGYEIEPGRVVTVTSEELVSVAPERSASLEVEQFVRLSDIDPVHFDRSYYVVPQAGAADRAYWLLFRAMEAAERVAVGRFVMRTREHLAAIRPAEHVLALQTLFYADEVRDPKQFWAPVVEEPPERQLQVARQLIETLTGEWEPARHRDRHREQLLELLRSKAELAFVSAEPEDEDEIAVTPAVDLMEALKASVEEARRARRAEDRQTG